MKIFSDSGSPEHKKLVDLGGTKILFANFPADGHFNPLTGLAAYLKKMGCDVRWYTSTKYAEKIARLGIPHYPLQKAVDVSDLEKSFPNRTRIKGQIARLRFDIVEAFINRGPEYYADLCDIQKEFDFDVLVADCAFTGIPFVTDKMNIPVLSIGVLPLTETSRDLPPAGLGLTPSYTWAGKIKQAFLRFVANQVLFKKPNQVMKEVLGSYGIDTLNASVFDLMVRKATLLLQSGSPGFEYYRSDLSSNIRFIGALLPHQGKKHKTPWFDERLNLYKEVILVTQGTVERDVEKIIVPVLEAYKDSEVLVVATTGGSDTAMLRSRFPHVNLIIEDFIPFEDIMPYADVYITNGGYGGVMLGIQHELPLVVAGIHEGKNEINARIGYFNLGINLKTEKPKSNAVRKAVDQVLKDKTYKTEVTRLCQELAEYNPGELTAYYIQEVLEKKGLHKRAGRRFEDLKI
ncbi:MAG: glycosyltransferase [Chitinophagaceae bacterium]